MTSVLKYYKTDVNTLERSDTNRMTSVLKYKNNVF
jgi:hypothetical protein